MTTQKFPLQPLIKDQDGRDRFKGNALVNYLLDHGGIDMNQLAMQDFPREDREQFAQLIGYSLSGFGELSYVSEETYVAAHAMANKLDATGLSELEARNSYLRNVLSELRAKMREPAALLFGIHPDDLGEEDTPPPDQG